MIELQDFNHNDWINQWAGTWSILSFSYWGNFYSRSPFNKYIDKYVDKTIIIWREGRSSAFQRQSNKEIFGKKVEKVIESQPDFPKKLCYNFKKRTSDFLKFAEDSVGKDINYKQYARFQDLLVDKYYPLHIIVKVAIDFLKPELLEKYLPIFEKARVFAEPVFTKSEEFMHELAKIHSKKTKISSELILCSIMNEFDLYLKDNNKLQSEKILKERYKSFVALFQNSEMKIFTGKDVNKIEEMVKFKTKNREIKGSVAYPGKASGIVRVIFDPKKAKNFNNGDILVSGMTRPEFLPIIKKAAGFITDSGGMLCHAAIVARELKKPCIIGTMIATKELKDGDAVELDTNKGVVRKI